MSGVKLNISVLDSKVQATLEEMRSRSIRLRPAMRSIGEYLLRETELRFDSQTDPHGMPWAPLSRERLAQKKHPKILTESTRLRGSISYRATDDMAQVGTNVVYAATHQLGAELKIPERTQVIAFKKKGGQFLSRKAASRRKTKVDVRIATIPARTVRIPDRPFLGVTGRNRREILEILRDHLNRG